MAIDIVCGAQALLPQGFKLGNFTNKKARTGCTVILCDAGANAGVDVRGAAPATRETDLLSPYKSVQSINAVVLAGGSAFGLESAQGVMRYLAERKVGFRFDTQDGESQVVPIVCGAALYDVENGPFAYPSAQDGYSACLAAGEFAQCGQVGAGTGATVSKLGGVAAGVPSGLGIASYSHGGLVITALSAVNALGDLYDPSTGARLTGALDTYEAMQAALDMGAAGADGANGAGARPAGNTAAVKNTTLSCVLTNAKLDKLGANVLARRLHDAYATCIKPVHTSVDGDTVFTMAHGGVQVQPDVLGTLAVRVLESAIVSALPHA
jgi:L-aminopeptidase/D-esterase-like protein